MPSIKTLEDIAQAIKNGADPEDFKDLLDSILDTELPEQDLELDEAWQRKYSDG